MSLFAAVSHAQTAPSLLEILSSEMVRNFRVLEERSDPAPYFISYEVVDRESCGVLATLGALQSSTAVRVRLLDVSVRVGSSELDNYRRIAGDRPQFASATQLPLEDNANAIRQRVWLDTDRTYRAASERLTKIRTTTQVRVAGDEKSPDFSTEKPAAYLEPPVALRFERDDWERRARRWSAAFERYPEILTSSVAVAAQSETKYFVNTEGSKLRHGGGLARIVITAQARAADGMDLLNTESFEAGDAAGLAPDAKVGEAIGRVAGELIALLRAPLAEPFVGPAILSGEAAGVFFHEIFGHRVEGHRQKDESEGQTFSKSAGTKVLPEFLSVIFDPTRRRQGDTDLNGYYLYDDEGVKARTVGVVENGFLKTFLMSRAPIPGFEQSNGHGRRQPGFEVVARQSNLFVESRRQVSEQRLREMLVQEIRRQNKPYGLYFNKVTGGYTQTRRGGLQAFTVIPLVVHRVYADGRPDELVRGVDIVGTPLTSFAKILATSDRTEVFNGYCGAESGSVPVAAVSPSLLVSEIEVQKKDSSTDRPPLLPRPSFSQREGG